MLRILTTISLFVFLAVAAVRAQQPQATPLQPSPVKRTILQRADIPGTNLELIYAVVEIAPSFKVGRHSHPGVVMGHVVEGEFWLAPDGEPENDRQGGEARALSKRDTP